MDHLSSAILMCAMLLLFFASVPVEGVVFGDDCTTESNCTEVNTTCINTCVCNNDTFRNTANNKCDSRVGFNETCVSGEPATQCTDDLAECRDEGGLKCLCKAANYKDSLNCEVRKKPNEPCESGQCVANAMCNTTCVCNTGYAATPTATPTSCQSSDAAIIIAHMYVFIFGIVASLYFLV